MVLGPACWGQGTGAGTKLNFGCCNQAWYAAVLPAFWAFLMVATPKVCITCPVSALARWRGPAWLPDVQDYVVEYCIRLPVNAFTGRGIIIGEGKAENHNSAMPYMTSELVQVSHPSTSVQT